MTGEKFTLMQYSVHAILGLIDAEDFVIPEIQRPFVLVTKKDAPLSKWAQEFFDFALSPDANKWIEKAGVVPAN